MFELVSWLSSPARFFEITDIFGSFVSFQHIALSVCSFKLTRLPLFICRYSSTAIHPSPFIDHHSSFLSLPLNCPIVSIHQFPSPFHVIDAYWCFNPAQSEAIQTSNRFMPVRLQSVLGWYKNYSFPSPLCFFFLFAAS